MRFLLALLAAASLAQTTIAADSETLFDGLGLRLVSTVDPMTDKRSCALFVDEGPIYLAIYGHADFVVWAHEDPKVLFAPDSPHLVRVGKAPPMALVPQSKRNGLKPKDPAAASAVIQGLARRELVRLRYLDWPSHDPHDVEFKNPNVAFVYAIATKRCGWKPLGVPSELAPVTLDIHEGKEPQYQGYARVKPEGNPGLELAKGFDKFGGGCHIAIGIHETFGMKGGQWTNAHVDTLKSTKLVIRDADGATVFSERVPGSYSFSRSGVTQAWPEAAMAARLAWQHSPGGSLALEGIRNERVSLYGFRELWKWGEAHGCWPSVADEPSAQAQPTK